MTDPVRLSIGEGIARLTFDRPERMNVLDAETAESFAAAVDRITADDSVRVVLMRGEGRSFMAGGDLTEFRDSADKPAAVRSIIQPAHRALNALEASPAITLVAAQGPVAGGGMSIVMGADLAICAEGTSFNMAYARIAAVPDCGGTWALPRLVGLRRAMELTLLSDTVKTAEALQMGLVNRVVPADALDTEAEALAARLAAGPGASQGRIKQLLRGSLGRDYAAQLDAEAEGFIASAATADFDEGITAFFGKRKPDYSGR